MRNLTLSTSSVAPLDVSRRGAIIVEVARLHELIRGGVKEVLPGASA
jgi:hypothetical protein